MFSVIAVARLRKGIVEDLDKSLRLITRMRV
jgi:hypothetical protein